MHLTAPCYFSLYMTPIEYSGRVYVILAVRCEGEDAHKLAVAVETSCLIDSMAEKVIRSL